MTTIIIENKELTIGDKIDFKMDTEQSGFIIAIGKKDNKVYLKIEPENEEFKGNLSKYKNVLIPPERCFIPYSYKTLKEQKERNNFLSNSQKVKLDDTYVTIGDEIHFKAGTEMSGTLVEILDKKDGIHLVLEDKDGFSGGYMNGETKTTERIDRCWYIGE